MNTVREDPGNTINVVSSNDHGESSRVLVDERREGTSAAEDNGGVFSRRLRGDIVPAAPLGPCMSIVLFVICIIIFIIALASLSVGSAVYVIMDVRSSTQGPPMWWSGILPLILAVCGIHVTLKGSRHLTWYWSIAMILSVIIQMSVMGVIGNFSSSLYDAWPNQIGVCRHFPEHDSCFCKDYFHGPYSQIEIPGLAYIYTKNIKWRQTRFNFCDDVIQMGKLFMCNIGLASSYALFGVLGAVLGIYASVCAKADNQVEIFTVSSDKTRGHCSTETLSSRADRELQPMGVLPADIDITDTVRLVN